MRIPSLCLLVLPALAAAQQQVPFLDRLKGMVDQAAATFQKATAASPKQAAEAKIAQASVTSLTFDNWKDVLQHSGKIRPYNPPEAFMVFITGGNTTCGSVGRCDRANKAWEESVPWLAGDISAPKLTSIDCESEEMLCGAWAAHIPSIWMILQPQPDQVAEKTRITVHNLNTTTVDDTVITKIHTRREYLGIAPYEGAFHPFDGWIAKLGLTTPMALTLFYLSKVPNWAFMIGLSVFSRYFVSRRMPAAQSSSSRAQAPAGAAGR